MSSPPIVVGVHVAWSLSFYVVFCRSLFVVLSLFSFGHCVVCPSIYSFWLPLWYLQTFLLKPFWHGYNVFLTIKDFHSSCHYILLKQNKACMLYFFSSSHMRSGVVILVSSLEDVNTICSRGLSENGRFFEPQYLVGIPKKLTLSNCPFDLPNMLVGFMVFNATFNNISIISWQSVLLVEEISWISSPFKFWTATIFLHEHLQVVYYKCVKFHKNPISRLGGVALTRYMDGRTGWFLYTTPKLCLRGLWWVKI